MKVKELLSDETKWCKTFEAIDKNGISTYPDSPEACQWCLEGAIKKCYANYVFKFVEIRKELQGHLIYKWNDNPKTTFEDVKKLINKLDI